MAKNHSKTLRVLESKEDETLHSINFTVEVDNETLKEYAAVGMEFAVSCAAYKITIDEAYEILHKNFVDKDSV